MSPDKTPAPKPKPPTIKDFEIWVEGRTGLTWREFFDAWVGSYDLTPKEIESLWNAIKGKEPKAPEKPKPKEPEKPKPKEPKVPPELIIERTPYPKWWKDSMAWNINIDGAGTHTVMSQSPGYRKYVSVIVLTVSGETNITFGLGTFGSSGAMNFGGEGQPMGMVIAMGNSPLPCGEGGFTITSTGVGVHVGGFIVYYYEKE